MTKIIITNNENKNNFIKQIRKKEPFTNYKFYSLNEFFNNFPYKFTNEALDFIISEENVILEVAIKYLKTLLFYPIEKLKTPKGLYLQNLKQKLIKNNLLQPNNLFYNFLKQNELLFYNILEKKDLTQSLKDFSNKKFITTLTNNLKPTIYELDNIDEEISFVGEKIAELINNKIDINKIYIKNINDDYLPKIIRIFNLMHIPIFLKERTNLIEIPIVSKFFNLYKQEEQKGIDYLQNLPDNQNNNDIICNVISVINKYQSLQNKISFIENELKSKKIKQNPSTNCVKEIDLLTITNEDEYVFILGFNNKCPVIYKDEDYLSDLEKDMLGYSTTTELNKLSKEDTQNMINNTKNCTITYSKTHLGKDCYPSSLLNNYEIKKENHLKFNVSHDFNKFYLAKLLDNYTKYNTITNELIILNNNYQIPYRTYEENFTGIVKEDLYTYLKNNLTISYTSLDNYNKCAFKYYLEHILKISPFEETFNIIIGNLYHHILERIYDEEFDFDYYFTKFTQDLNLDYKDKYFLNKLKKELNYVIDIIKNQEKFSSLKNKITEETVEIPIKGIIPVTFKGKIDKLSYLEVDNHTVINITDYKTGNTTINPSYFPLGFNLQLPTYLFLANKIKKFNNIILGGFYLQKVILPKIKFNAKKNYETEQKNSLKLQGYSNPSKNILELVDNSYQDSKLITGLKEKKDGNFAFTSKMLDEETTTKLTEIIEKNIYNCVDNILNAKFQIDPKIIDNKDNISCEYCKFKDICYKKAKDYIYLESDKTFLKKEENNGLDD